MSLLHAEIRKLTTIRTTWVLTALGAVLVAVSGSVFTFVGEIAGDFTGSSEQVARGIDQVGGNSVIPLVVALLVMTTEFRYGTIGRTLQLAPSRTRVMLAKLSVGAMYAVVFTVVGLVVIAIVLGIAAATNGVSLEFGGEVGTSLWQVTVALVLTALLGVAVGALLRGQVLALTLSLVWVFVAESLIFALWSAGGRWLPFQALESIFRDQEAMGAMQGPFGPMAEPLEPGVALLVFLGYVVVATVAATVLMRVRDV